MNHFSFLRKFNLKFRLQNILFLLFLVLLQIPSNAEVESKSIRFKKHNDKSGLSNNWVNAITEDDRGFIWIATRSGLNVYDGNQNHIYTYNHNDSGSISFNDISDVTYVSKGYVFAGTWGGGLNIIDARTREVKRVGKNKFEKTLFVKSIVEDGDSNVWISTYGQGIYIYSFENEELVKCNHQELGNKFSYNQDMTYHNDTVWIVSRNDGLGFIPTKKKKEIISVKKGDSLNDITHINYINNKLYLGTFTGEVLNYDFRKNSLDTIFNLKLVPGHHNRINAMSADINHNLWISTSTGFFKYSSNSKKLIKISPPNTYEDYNDNFCSLVDSRGILWMGTWGNGLYSHVNSDQIFKKIELNESTKKIIQAIQPLNDSIFLLATSSGIVEYNSRTQQSKKIKPKGKNAINITNNIINSIMPYNNQYLVAVDGAGLFIMDSLYNISQLSNSHNSILTNSSIIGMNALNNGERWIGTWSKGGAILNEKTGFYREFNTQTENDSTIKCKTVYCAYLTKKGKTLIGTEDGILEYNSEKDKFTKVPLFIHLQGEKNALSAARAITEDAQGNLWVASIHGLVKYEHDTYVDKFLLTEENGLINKLIHNMVCTGNSIWATTKSGLIQLNTKNNTIENYTVSDGLPSNSFNDNGIFYNGNLLYLALGSEVIYFNPKNISKPSHTIQLEIINFLIDDNLVNSNNSILKKHISNYSDLELKYNQNNISFDVAILDFKGQLDGKYVHTLEGFDKKWVEHSYSNTKIRYTNLPPGEYVFKLAIVLENQSISEDKKTIRITIPPPFWQTLWFKFICGISIPLIFLFLLHLRTKRITDQNKSLESQVSKRTSQLEISNLSLNEQKKAIESNIRYAAVIQNALLPTHETIKKGFENFFVFNKPKDGVSGDFFWFSKSGSKSIFALADCTGHGVSGSFVSVLGVSFLNNIVENKKIIRPDLILNELQKKTSSTFSKNNKTINDGMDISIICYDSKSKVLEVSSAKSSPLLIWGNEKLERIIGDRFSIGNSEITNIKTKSFSLNTFSIINPSTIYLFSDGFKDQFGGSENKKYMQKKFREFLFSLCDKSIEQQSELIEKEFTNWKQDFEQTDDVLVAGIQLV